MRDPPFSQLDLVACRNLLIYLNRDTQERVMDIFNFGLKTGGYLFLGPSEALDTSATLFKPVEKKFRVYRSLPNPRRRSASVLPDSGRWQVKFSDAGHSGTDYSLSFPALHYRILEPYGPPSILVDENYEVMHLSEHAGRYLRFAGGEPTRNLLKSIHPDLQLDLRAALLTSNQENRRAEFGNIPLTLDGEARRGANPDAENEGGRSRPHPWRRHAYLGCRRLRLGRGRSRSGSRCRGTGCSPQKVSAISTEPGLGVPNKFTSS